MPFIAADVTRQLVRALVPLLKKLKAHDKDLEDQVRRAARNAYLNLREANKRKGADRSNRFGWTVSEAEEVTGALELAVDFGYLDLESVQEVLDLADRVRALAYRLQHPK